MTPHIQSSEGIDQGTLGGEFQQQCPLTASIHMLDDDSLLNVFLLYRPSLLGEDDDDDDNHLVGGEGGWERGRWWYSLAHVCQRWRDVVLGSASYLGVSLVCTKGTAVADMLAHSPPLPLDVDYSLGDHENITAENEEGAILALKRYDRVRRVRLRMPATSLQKLIVAMDDEYPILEHLVFIYPVNDNTSILTFPGTLHAPHLRHLVLFGFALPMESRLLTTAVGLITLCLVMFHPSTYFYPNTLLRWLSFMPQLETLVISFILPVCDCCAEWQLTHTPITSAHILPNLRVFRFQGVGTFLETFVHQITAPRLEKLQLEFFYQLTFSFPRLLQFVSTTNLRFMIARFEFCDRKLSANVYSHDEAETYALSIAVNCCHLDWQVSSAAQIFNSLSPTFSAVDHLTLQHEEHSQSSEEHDEVDPTKWLNLLGSFRNVRTLRIANGFVKELSRCLQLDDGELSLEVLPELQELKYLGSGNSGDEFTRFANARQDAGRPLTLTLRSPSPDRSSSVSSLESSSISPASSEEGGDVDTPIRHPNADQRAVDPSDRPLH